jgi:uncharacterized membrane-anchored protein
MLSTGALVAPAQEPEFEEFPLPELQWQSGPVRANIGHIAAIDLPDGYEFLEATDTQTILELFENPVSGAELGLIAPAGRNFEWFVVFEFDDIGYVKDDEKDQLDADAMLQAMREGTRQSNIERRQRGWATMEVIGWEQPPHYDERTHNLEWAIRAESDGELIVNYNTRILGRKGVMDVSLVVDPEDLASVLPEFKKLLSRYTFVEGEKYAEFKAGDKVAQYGLTALVTGGAAAVALKTGLLQKLWKFIVIGAIAVGAFFKKIVGGLFGGGRETTYQ